MNGKEHLTTDVAKAWAGHQTRPDIAAPSRAETKASNPKDAIGVRKVSLSCLPIRVLWNVALAMMEGALKYGKSNYRAVGVRSSVYFDSVVGRHLFSWWEGEDIDPESGLHHIDKAISGLMVLRDSILQGNCLDDRPPCGVVDLRVTNAHAGALVDFHEGKDVRHYTIADSALCAVGNGTTSPAQAVQYDGQRSSDTKAQSAAEPKNIGQSRPSNVLK